MTISKRLSIGVDGYNLGMPHGTGIATYGRTLCTAIKSLGQSLDLLFGVAVAGDSDAARETMFFSNLARGEPSPRKFKASFAAIRAHLRPGGTARPTQVLETGRVLRDGSPIAVPHANRLFSDERLFSRATGHFRRTGEFLKVELPSPPMIMHWTYPLPIEVIGARNIYTIHDLVPLRMPYASTEDKSYYERLVRACVVKGSRICTVSERSRTDIIEILGAAADRVVNTYQAIDDFDAMAAPKADDANILRLFGLDRDNFFLFFGAVEPKKNIDRLIEGHAASGSDKPLVIVRAGGWTVGERKALIEVGAEASNIVRVLDYLPRRLLISLIRSASAVLFPALYEGFGLPAAEALALGTPVLASKTGALPEIVGEAAVIVDPFDVFDIAGGIRALSSDAGLRKRLAAMGPRQVAHFSTERYAGRLADLYGGLFVEPHAALG